MLQTELKWQTVTYDKWQYLKKLRGEHWVEHCYDASRVTQGFINKCGWKSFNYIMFGFKLQGHHSEVTSTNKLV